MSVKKSGYYEYDPDTGDVELKDEPVAVVDKWQVFKQIVGAAASGCATVVVSRYLKSNMPDAKNMFEKAVMGVGMYFITGVVGAKVAKYAEQELDEWRDGIVKIKEAADDRDAK